jgi:hypothetical protein
MVIVFEVIVQDGEISVEEKIRSCWTEVIDIFSNLDACDGVIYLKYALTWTCTVL